jgi:hypothetical protein
MVCMCESFAWLLNGSKKQQPQDFRVGNSGILLFTRCSGSCNSVVSVVTTRTGYQSEVQSENLRTIQRVKKQDMMAYFGSGWNVLSLENMGMCLRTGT